MPNEKTISEKYNDIVCDLAERAKMIMEEEPSLDRTDTIWRAEDEGLIYTEDQAIIVANAFRCGLTRGEKTGWGAELDWEAIGENLYSDISDELDELIND